MVRRTKGREAKGKLFKKTIYIFTEGETESNYFRILNRKYKSSTNVKVETKSVGKQGKSLIQHAIGRKEKMTRKEKNNLGGIYVIFDKDDINNNDFQEALKLAKENDIKIGFSNKCFEIWMLAHFEKPNGSHVGKKLFIRLGDYLGCKQYEKNHKSDIVVLHKLEDFVSMAISNTKDMPEFSQKIVNEVPYTNIAQVIQEVYNREIY